ncbi:hypothetical protein [Paracoccus cavernae]|uniref:hypothetical protein n=1 Tax=Paracoccus cavernae TaxID=1571207 RepID=UPI003628D69E
MPTPPTQYRYPCDNCGASLQFSPGQQKLICPYCGHEQDIGPGAARAPARQKSEGPWGERAILADPETGRAIQWDAGHKAPNWPRSRSRGASSSTRTAISPKPTACSPAPIAVPNSRSPRRRPPRPVPSAPRRS